MICLQCRTAFESIGVGNMFCRVECMNDFIEDANQRLAEDSGASWKSTAVRQHTAIVDAVNHLSAIRRDLKKVLGFTQIVSDLDDEITRLNKRIKTEKREHPGI